MKPLSYDEKLYRICALCSISEHCATDIRTKLEKWDTSPDEIEKILTYLNTEKYLDETRYARAFVKDKFRFNKWGRIKLSYELRAKGISPTIITEALAEIDEENYLETLQELLHEKRKHTKGNSTFEINGKLLRFAQSRGFEMNIALKALDEKMEI